MTEVKQEILAPKNNFPKTIIAYCLAITGICALFVAQEADRHSAPPAHLDNNEVEEALTTILEYLNENMPSAVDGKINYLGPYNTIGNLASVTLNTKSNTLELAVSGSVFSDTFFHRALIIYRCTNENEFQLDENDLVGSYGRARKTPKIFQDLGFPKTFNSEISYSGEDALTNEIREIIIGIADGIKSAPSVVNP